jgi:hypothetical protein
MGEPQLETEEALQRSLGRIQTCVDQLIGQDHFLPPIVTKELEGPLREARQHTMKLLQKELDNVLDLTGLRSPASEAEGAHWLLNELRSR